MRRPSRLLIVLFTLLALIAAACGDDGSGDTDAPDPEEQTEPDPAPETDPAPDTDPASEEETPPTDEADPAGPERTASARGITEDTIHIGMAIADVTRFVVSGDQNARFQEIADVINENGGVIGRQLELHFADWELLDTSGFDAACVSLTQDTEVFAVVARVPANFGEMTCFTQLNEHLVVNALEVDESEVANSDGRLFSILADPFSALAGGLATLAPELADAKVAITTSDTGDGEAKAVELATVLTDLGIDVVETTVGTISFSADEQASLAEQNRFAELWRVAGATHVVGIGNAVIGAANALEETGANQDIVLITPNISTRTLESLNVDLSTLEMIGISAPLFSAIGEQGLHGMPECIALIDAAGLGPVEFDPPEGELEALASTAGACATLDFLTAVLEAAGPNPTQGDFLDVTNGGFSFEMTTAGSASVAAGKAYMNDDPGVIYDWDPVAMEFTPRA